MSDKISLSSTPTIDKILELAPQTFLDTTEGEWIYNPNRKEYVRIQDLLRPKARTRSISNAEALLAVVIEEARRHGNETGDSMTVIFTDLGGMFFTDDRNRHNQDTWEFQRKNSRELEALTQLLDKPMDHAGLLRAMSLIRYSVKDFAQIYSAMRRVRINKGMQFASQPRVEDGQSGSELQFTFQIEGVGAGKASFPSEFTVEIPMISMSSVRYQIEVEIDASIEDKSMVFALRAPGLFATKTQAVMDEISAFKAAASKALPEMLIVTDL